ncbi:unnamed protein product, partial [Hapterophycus canaliculatus]
YVQCFCSDVGETPSRIGKSTSCNMACVGDNTQTCGGRDAFSAYKFTDVEVPPPSPTPPAPTPPTPTPPATGDDFSEVGCFADPKGGRIMPIYFPE